MREKRAEKRGGGKECEGEPENFVCVVSSIVMNPWNVARGLPFAATWRGRASFSFPPPIFFRETATANALDVDPVIIFRNPNFNIETELAPPTARFRHDRRGARDDGEGERNNDGDRGKR